MSPKQKVAKDRRHGEKRMGEPRPNTATRCCGRTTKDGGPCGLELQWYQAACHYHATPQEQADALDRLRDGGPTTRRTA